jgi:hypothetical protein
MKLKLLRLLEKLLLRIESVITPWREEIGWQVIAATPVGPNPHEEGTIEWFLHKEGNRLRASHRLVAKMTRRSPWIDLISKNQP